MPQSEQEPARCPLCGQPLYGWIALPPEGERSTVGMPLGDDATGERVIDRCEACGVALEADREPDLVAEWDAICEPRPDGTRVVAIPNRASLQAAIGVEGWAAIELSAGGLLLTPRSLQLLAEHNGERLERMRWPRWGRGQAWMWQTLLNGLTFHPNFAREARAGRLRPATARSRLTFGIDLVVTILGAPLVAIVSFPLELGAALARRGGEMVAQARSPDARAASRTAARASAASAAR